MTAVGANIKYYRTLHHYTQNDLANATLHQPPDNFKVGTGVSQPTIEYLIGLSEFFQITVDELIKVTHKAIKEEETIMKKAIFLVRNYTPSNNSEWGKEAKDYGTRDFIANLSKIHHMYEWRAAKPAELPEILNKENIGMIAIAPTVTPRLKEIEAQYPGKIQVISPAEYAKITTNFILER